MEEEGDALRRARLENETLYAVIKTVSSSLDLDRVLRGIVEIANDATACHACFIYFVEAERLVLRAASPRYSSLVGQLALGLDEGLAGWVARTKTPEFIRENAMADPRMKFVPELDEESFQSMVAVPILAKAGDVIGVVVLHTEAPREFDDDVLNFLVHTASLVAGAIENAQLYEETRRRVQALTTLTQLSQALAAVTMREDLYEAVARGARELLRADVCLIYRLDVDADELILVSSDPEDAAAPSPRPDGTSLVLNLMRRNGGRGRNGGGAVADDPWPEMDEAVLAVPLLARNEQLGMICCLARERQFSDEDAELLGAVADQTAVGLKKAELIERLTAENIVKDMFDALAAGSVDAAQTKASEARCDLAQPARLPARRAGAAGTRLNAPSGPRWPPGSRRDCGACTRERSSTHGMTGCGRSRRRRAPTARSRRCARLASRSVARTGWWSASATSIVARRAAGGGCAKPPTRPGSGVRWSPRAAPSPTSNSAPTATSSTSSSTRPRAIAITSRSRSWASTTAAAAPGWWRPWSSSSPTAAASPRAPERSTCTPTRCASDWSGSSASPGSTCRTRTSCRSSWR